MEKLFIEIDKNKKIKYMANNNHSKPDLLLLHGITARSEYFVDIYPYLTENYNIYAPDFRGHGESFRSDEPYNLFSYVNDIKAFHTLLIDKPCFILGFSMGGRVALSLIIENPDIAKKLIVVDVGPDIDPAGLNRMINAQQKLPDFFKDISELEEFYKKYYGALSKDYINKIIFHSWNILDDGRAVTSYDRKIWKVDMEGILNECEYLNNNVSKIQIPILILHGANSDVLSSEDSKKFLSKLQFGKLIDIPNSTHGVLNEETEKCNDIINEFFINDKG